MWAADGTPHEARPAFYALEPGGWRDYVTLLHLPYTAWHLAYVVVGGCLVAGVAWGRLGPHRARVRARDGDRRARARRAPGPPARDDDPVAGARRARRPVGRARPARSGSPSRSRRRSGSCRSSRSARSSSPRTTSSSSAVACTPTSASRSPGARSPSSPPIVAQAGAVRAEAALAAAWATLLSLAQRRLSHATPGRGGMSRRRRSSSCRRSE